MNSLHIDSFLEQKNKRIQQEIRRLQLTYALNVRRKPLIKVYGLLRTGTNYLTRLIDLNFDAFCLASNELGWKHGPCKNDLRLNYVFAVKDPYSWLVSFMEWEKIHHRFSGDSIAEFMNSPVTHPGLRDAWGETDVVSVWSRSLGSWSTLSESENVVYIRYEDVAKSFSTELLNIGKILNLKQKTPELINLKSRADTWKTPLPRKERDKNYYSEAQYMDQFTEADLIIIREKLDPNLVNKFGYKLL